MASQISGCSRRSPAHAALAEESERVKACARGSHQSGVEHGSGMAIGAIGPGISRTNFCVDGFLKDECEWPARIGHCEADFEYPVRNCTRSQRLCPAFRGDSRVSADGLR